MKKHLLLFVVLLTWSWRTQAQPWLTYQQPAAKTVTVDLQNRVWAGGQGGVWVLESNSWVSYNAQNSGLLMDGVLCSAIDQQGILWFGTLSGASTFDYANNTWVSHTLVSDSLPGTRINDITIDAQNRKWLGTNNGVALLDGTSRVIYNTSNSGLVNNYILRIYIDSQGNAWFGTVGGVSRFDGTSWTSYTIYNSGLTNNNIRAIAQDPQGRMWFATDDGLCTYVNNTWNTFPIAAPVTDIAVDAGGIWFATAGWGALHYNGTDITEYNTGTSGIMSNNIACIVADNSCRLWLGNLSDNGISGYSYCLDTPEEETLSLQLYPNPTADRFTVTYTQTGKSELSVYTLTGQPVLHVQNPVPGSAIDVSHLAAGIYFVQVESPTGKSARIKIIKQ